MGGADVRGGGEEEVVACACYGGGTLTEARRLDGAPSDRLRARNLVFRTCMQSILRAGRSSSTTSPRVIIPKIIYGGNNKR